MTALILVVCGSFAASAGRLDKATCAALGDEYIAATAAGIEAEMARGADWAKSNLKRDQINAIMRFIEVEQQLEFRCHRNTIAKARDRAKMATTDSDKKEPAAPTGPPPGKQASPATEATKKPAVAPKLPPPAATSKTPSKAEPGKNARAAPPAKVIIKPPVARTEPPTGGTKPQPAAPAHAPEATEVGRPKTAVNAPAVPAAPGSPAGIAKVPSPSTKGVPHAKSAATDATAAITPAVAPATSEAPGVAAKITPAPSPDAKASPEEEKATTATRRKRRTPSSAYVAPREVSPFSIPGFSGR